MYSMYFNINRGDDTTGEARLRSDWNKHLMKDVIAPLYALLLVKACGHLETLLSNPSPAPLCTSSSSPSSTQSNGRDLALATHPTGEHSSHHSSPVECSSPYSILSLFPCPVPPDCWGSVPDSLFPLLADQRILFSRINDGSYLSLGQAILLESCTNVSTFLSMPSLPRPSTTLNDSEYGNNSGYGNNVLKQQFVHHLSNRTHTELDSTERLERLLLLENLPIAVVPTEVYVALLASGCVCDRVTPAFVRKHFSLTDNMKSPSHPALSSAASASADCDRIVGEKVNKDTMKNDNDNKKAAEMEKDAEKEEEEKQGSIRREETLSNTIFLLQYSFLDISGDVRWIRNNSNSGSNSNTNTNTNTDRDVEKNRVRGDDLQPFTSLHGLCILPLEDGTLGVIQESTCTPLYLVNNAERRLLQRAGKSLIVSDSLLGPAVCSILRDPTFSEYCNVRTLTPVDTLKLLRTYLPRNWFESSVTTVIKRESSVSDEWLGWLWSYILEEKSINLFEGIFPLLPILSPASFTPGRYLVKVSKSVPVLHMSFCDLPSDASDALSRLGIYVLDSAVIGGSAYSSDIGRLVSESSPKGLIHAICVASAGESYIRNILAWPQEIKRAMRDLLLDRVVSKIDFNLLTEEEKDVMFSMPVWERYLSGVFSPTNSIADSSFGPLHPTQTLGSKILDPNFCMQIPPRNVDVAFFGINTLVLRNDQDRFLYLKIGLIEPSKG